MLRAGTRRFLCLFPHCNALSNRRAETVNPDRTRRFDWLLPEAGLAAPVVSGARSTRRPSVGHHTDLKMNTDHATTRARSSGPVRHLSHSYEGDPRGPSPCLGQKIRPSEDPSPQRIRPTLDPVVSDLPRRSVRPLTGHRGEAALLARQEGACRSRPAG